MSRSGLLRTCAGRTLRSCARCAACAGSSRVTHPSPHDAFVKAVFSRPENAAGELRAVLPPALLAHLDLSTLEASPKSFVDEKLRSRHTDLLLRARFAGRPAFIYVLLEHQSTPDPQLVIRLAVYMGKIWDDWLRAHEDDRAARAPAVIPLVLYHGAAGWNVASELIQAFDLELRGADLDAIRPHLPNFRIVLDDLVRQDDRDLRVRETAVLGRMALLLLKHLRQTKEDGRGLDELMTRLGDLVQLLPAGTDRVLAMSYIQEVDEKADPQLLIAALGVAATPSVVEDIMTAADRLRLEGAVRERRNILTLLLKTKFPGRVDARIEGQIQGAEAATLIMWMERVLTAASPDEVLQPT